jgi:hypothetical protein
MRESRAMAAVVEFEKTRGFRVAAGALVLALALIAVTVIVYQRAHQQALTHVRIAGGGFLVYYRLGEIRAGITVLVQKATTSQSRIVATFEDPAGGADIVLERRIHHGLTRYGLETPAVHGVVKDQPYRVRAGQRHSKPTKRRSAAVSTRRGCRTGRSRSGLATTARRRRKGSGGRSRHPRPEARGLGQSEIGLRSGCLP